MCEKRNIQYKIIFKNPINLLDILVEKNFNLENILSDEKYKKISSRLLDIECNNDVLTIIDLKNDSRLKNSVFFKKYKFFNDEFFSDISFLELNESSDKYIIVKKMYDKITMYKKKFGETGYYNYYIFQLRDMCYDEFEYEIDLMLEEFKLFLDKFKYDKNEKKIIDIFILDKDLKSNIKFIGWYDFYIE